MPTATRITTATAVAPAVKVEPLTCAIGAEVQNVNLGAAARDPRADGRDPVAAAAVQGAVLPRPGHHARGARRLCPPFWRARGPSGRRQRSRSSWPRAHLQIAGETLPPVRERLA